MDFSPAGEFIGEAHQVRTVGLRHSRELPGGDYRFLDTYCTDPSCDCRKTIILVYRNDIHVSTIHYGWESDAFYRKWMGSAFDDNNDLPMSGASIDISSPNHVPPKAMLAFFQALLDDNWIAKFKTHYAGVKKKIAETGRKKKKNRRNRNR